MCFLSSLITLVSFYWFPLSNLCLNFYWILTTGIYINSNDKSCTWHNVRPYNSIICVTMVYSVMWHWVILVWPSICRQTLPSGGHEWNGPPTMQALTTPQLAGHAHVGSPGQHKPSVLETSLSCLSHSGSNVEYNTCWIQFGFFFDYLIGFMWIITVSSSFYSFMNLTLDRCSTTQSAVAFWCMLCI